MKIVLTLIGVVLICTTLFSQDNFENIDYNSEITSVQPMTGIVLWNTSSNNETDAISLEFSYMLFNEVVKDSGVYDWNVVETKLNDIKSRNHQAIFRFRYVYPGYKTSVPQYILDRTDYDETIGLSEGKETHFPDWTNTELQRFSLEFYKKFAERYDTDPRLAFIQVGFGLWGEYHIYDGPFILGKTFPSKAFQEQFFYNLDSCFTNIPWSISIDAADDTYSPFAAKPELKNLYFGLFDDSFMHSSHSGYNTTCWNFFDRNRYQSSPAGGEFSYYSNYDQTHVLDYPDGPYGKPFETFARDFHITYMIGNDQPKYQTIDRIKEASMASGYRFKLVSIKTKEDSTIFEIKNIGVAPIYYDAYITVNGIRSSKSLKNLSDGEKDVFHVSESAKDAKITIECDRLLENQTIEFFGTQTIDTKILKGDNKENSPSLFPNPVKKGGQINITNINKKTKFTIYNYNGIEVMNGVIHNSNATLSTEALSVGIYHVLLSSEGDLQNKKFIIF